MKKATLLLASVLVLAACEPREEAAPAVETEPAAMTADTMTMPAADTMMADTMMADTTMARDTAHQM